MMVPARPFVTVIVPMRNEEAWIERCVLSILEQDYPADRMEVLIVDGLSTDGSPELLKQLADRDPRIRILDNPARIVPSSLNLALRCARGDVITRVDAHTLLAADYLSTGVDLLVRSAAENVGGPMVCIGSGAVGNAIAETMGSRFGIGAYFHFATDERVCDTVYMGMWPRRVFETVGLFDEQLVRNQDDEHSYRIRKAGGRIVLSPKMRSSYQNRQSWRALIRQFFQYGLWKVRVLQKHPSQMSVRHFVPPLMVAGLITGALSAPFAPRFAAVMGIGYVVYLTGLVGVSSVHGGSPAAIARRFFALTAIHHAWGAGFILGLARFASYWRHGETEPERLGRTERPVG